MPYNNFAAARRSFLRFTLLGGVAALSGCSLTGPGPGRHEDAGAPVPPTPAPGADTLGNGPVKVALILPLTQGGGQSAVGVSMRNAAELAILESGANDITLLVKDDRSTPDGAREATQAAIGQGAELILGPLFAGDVRAAAEVAKPAGKPLIAYSTDLSTASRGVYLLSFLVEDYVDRIIEFAASRGKKSVAVLAPENDYANVAAGALQQAAAKRDMRVALIERYKAGAVAASVANVAALGAQIDCIFIPEQAAAMPDVARALTAERRGFPQDPDPRHRPVERFPRSQPAGLAGRLVRHAGKRRFLRLRPALSRQIRLRPDPRGDAGL